MEYGQSVSHAAKKAGGGEILLFRRQGVDDYPLVGWRRIQVGELEFFEGPQGERCSTLAEAFDVVMTSKVSSEGQKDARIAVSVLHRFLTETVATTTSRIETQHPDGHDLVGVENAQIPTSRVLVTTSTIEDWLWRGDDALVKDMSLQIESLCLYKMERVIIATMWMHTFAHGTSKSIV